MLSLFWRILALKAGWFTLLNHVRKDLAKVLKRYYQFDLWRLSVLLRTIFHTIDDRWTSYIIHMSVLLFPYHSTCVSRYQTYFLKVEFDSFPKSQGAVQGRVTLIIMKPSATLSIIDKDGRPIPDTTSQPRFQPHFLSPGQQCEGPPTREFNPRFQLPVGLSRVIKSGYRVN